MIREEHLYQMALTCVPQIGSIQAKLLLEHFRSPKEIFNAKKKELSAIEGIGPIRAAAIKSFRDFDEIEEEFKIMEQEGIEALFIQDARYPRKLAHCSDAPIMLFFKGNVSLNPTYSISVIGTRRNTLYGKKITEEIIQELSSLGVLIVSGLAFGIDIIAHQAALQAGLPTIGVMAHGHSTIYPSQHASIAKKMLQQGGLLTECNYHTEPDRHQFPKRNRIVAGMTDATIVIETAAKGGSIITAELAHDYNRDVFAIPGRIQDKQSEGCLDLIHQHKAAIFTNVHSMIEELGWKKHRKPNEIQIPLFAELSEDEQTILKILQEKEDVHVDEIYRTTGWSCSQTAAQMLHLEMKGLIKSLPGKRYTTN
jgi:DNA processing protein